MDFEWDEAKDKANQAKHNIKFDEASKIFLGNLFERPSSYEGEKRIMASEKYQGRFITVIYTMRGNVCRIISARAARRNERNNYGKDYPQDT